MNGPKDPWPHVLSLPGAQGGLMETPPRWHTTIYMYYLKGHCPICVKIMHPVSHYNGTNYDKQIWLGLWCHFVFDLHLLHNDGFKEGHHNISYFPSHPERTNFHRILFSLWTIGGPRFFNHLNTVKCSYRPESLILENCITPRYKVSNYFFSMII